MMRVVLKCSTVKKNRRACVMISIFVTSLARVIMFKHLDALGPDGEVFKLSCDSLFFSYPKAKRPPLVLSESFGDFKKCYQGNVHGLVQLGVSSYSLIHEENGTWKQESRVCGLQVNNLLAGEVTFARLLQLLDETIVDQLQGTDCTEELSVENVRTFHRDLKVASVRRRQTISASKVFNRRLIDYSTETLRTLPFGWRD